MAQISQTLYNTIAQSYALIEASLSGISENARDALDAIVNVDTADYPNPSNADADAALEIELALLATFNLAYTGSLTLAASNSSLLAAVSTVNSFVIKEQVYSGTAKAKLDYFINTDMAGYWSVSNCPQGWAEVSLDAGYDTSSWTI